MIRICAVAELPDGVARRVIADVPIAVVNSGGTFFAVDDTCTHQDASLADGYVEDCTLECPLHAARFDLRTGVPLDPPARVGLRTHTVVVRDGSIYLIPATGVADAGAVA
jgi:3-phenylpropionate/trans-cinnamate dioxygenase ferredoxin subunit